MIYQQVNLKGWTGRDGKQYTTCTCRACRKTIFIELKDDDPIVVEPEYCSTACARRGPRQELENEYINRDQLTLPGVTQ